MKSKETEAIGKITKLQDYGAVESGVKQISERIKITGAQWKIGY